MIPLTTLEKVIAGITYKPGWSISCLPLSHDSIRINICMKVWTMAPLTPDLSSLTVTFSIIHHGYAMLSRDESITLLYRLIRECEEHEIKEWLLIDGVKVYDPHVPGSVHEYRSSKNPETVSGIVVPI